MAKSKRAAVPAQKQQSSQLKSQTVVVVPPAAKEGCDILTPGQYLHVKDLVKQLIGFGQRNFESLLDIKKLNAFWELRDKGGTLGKINIRIYFFHDTEANEVVILSTYKKENDGAVPQHVLIRIRNRLRIYKAGGFNKKVIRYQRKTT